MVANPTDRLRRLATELLDSGYASATDAVMRSIAKNDPALEKALRELLAEAQRLAETGHPLTRDNAFARAALGAFEDTLRRNAADLDNAASTVQEAGAAAAQTLSRQLSLPGFSDDELERLGIAWQAPDPAAIAQAVQYATSAGWNNEMRAFVGDLMLQANNVLYLGMALGRNPRAIARDLRDVVTTLPAYRAENLMRTMYLTSYRDSNSAYMAANADILDGQIRIGTLDGRICLCCLALHGTELPIGARVDDHHQGRCTAIGKIKGFKFAVQTGAEYWAGLTFEQQSALGGYANAEALRQGAVTLRDFVQPYTDQVFGQMLREASLKGLLGDQAAQYYARNNK